MQGYAIQEKALIKREERGHHQWNCGQINNVPMWKCLSSFYYFGAWFACRICIFFTSTCLLLTCVSSFYRFRPDLQTESAFCYTYLPAPYLYIWLPYRQPPNQRISLLAWRHESLQACQKLSDFQSSDRKLLLCVRYSIRIYLPLLCSPPPQMW